MINVKVTTKGNAPAAMQKLPPAVKRAARRAQSDTMKRIRTELVRRTTERYHVKATRIRKAMQASTTQLRISGERTSLGDYKISPSKPTKKPRQVSAAVKKEGGLKPLSSRAFLMRSGNKTLVMERIGAARLPIRRLYSLAVPQAVGAHAVIEDLAEFAEDVFTKRFGYWSMQNIGAIKT